MAQTTFSEKELKAIYDFALDLGRRAGQILLDGVEKRTGAQENREVGEQVEKMNAVDIVTQTDLGMCLLLGVEGTGGYANGCHVGYRC